MVESATTDAVRAIIVDDEPLARDCVRLALQDETDSTIIEECATGEAAVEAIIAGRPDLVFLDVQMPGMNGFDVLEVVGPHRMPAVVFVTAYDEHAMRAFEVHAVDYVLKPFDDARFRDAVRHARRSLNAGRDSAARERLRRLLAERTDGTIGDGWTTRIMVRVRDRIRVVNVDDVDWFESAGNYVRIRTGTDSYLVRRTLASMAESLDPARFVRVHRSTIINIGRVRELRPASGGDYIAFLEDGSQRRVSRAYRDALLGM
jgi:two-component system, LytTR family, response regulator